VAIIIIVDLNKNTNNIQRIVGRHNSRGCFLVIGIDCSITSMLIEVVMSFPGKMLRCLVINRSCSGSCKVAKDFIYN